MPRPLGEVADVFAGLMITPGDRESIGRQVSYLSVRSLTGLGVDAAQLEEVRLGDRDVSRFVVRTGDVVLSARSTSLKTDVVSAEFDGILMNATLLGIRCSEVIHPRLLKGWLDSNAGRAALESVTQTGTAQMNVTVAALKALPIPVPPIQEQRQIVELLDAADAAYRSAIAAADTRRRLALEILENSLLGKIRHHE